MVSSELKAEMKVGSEEEEKVVRGAIKLRSEKSQEGEIQPS